MPQLQKQSDKIRCVMDGVPTILTYQHAGEQREEEKASEEKTTTRCQAVHIFTHAHCNV